MPAATVIGDVVESRRYRDQEGLLQTLAAALAWVNERLSARQPLQLTVGDEFQGVYEEVATALEATLLVRLRLAGFSVGGLEGRLHAPDLRFGVGWGEVVQADVAAAPLAQSGPGWWSARRALDEVAAVAAKVHWPKSLRTVLRGVGGEVEGAINAFLVCRDELLGRMDERDARITLALFLGERQVDVARELGISQPAVARRVREKGASAVFRGHAALRVISA